MVAELEHESKQDGLASLFHALRRMVIGRTVNAEVVEKNGHFSIEKLLLQALSNVH